MPSEPTNVRAKKYSFAAGLRKGYLRHLFSGNSNDISAISQPNIAFHHFPEEIIILNSRHLHGAQFIKSIDSECGKKVGMQASDKIKGSCDYYALPNQSIIDAEMYVAKKDMERHETGAQLQTPARVSNFSKKAYRNSISSAEAIITASAASELKLARRREDDRTIRASLSQMQEESMTRVEDGFHEKYEKLKLECVTAQDQAREAESLVLKEVENRNEIQGLHRDSIGMLCSTGLQRGLILSASWHTSNPTMCLHLLGFHNFKEYKVYCSCLFPELKMSYGKSQSDAITEWEKCTEERIDT